MPEFDFGKLLETVSRMQTDMARTKAELAKKTVTGESGAGMVTAVVDGTGALCSLNIEASLLSPENKKAVEDLVAGAINQALQRAQVLAQEELAKTAGGLPIPPGMFGAGT